jgi:chaperonin GroEL
MILPKREIKKIWLGDDATSKAIEGSHKMAEVVGSTYGPSGRNVILGMPFGDATLTRDGVTVAKRTILEDKAEDDAAQILRQASEKTNKTAGDGTTATIVLANSLFSRGNRLVAAGENGMLLKKQISEDSRKIIDFLNEKSQDAKGHLLDVATVSAGDPAIGQLVSETLLDIGNEGGISIREQNYPTIDVEKVGGYYFDRGFFALNQQVEYANPVIFVTNKQLAANADIIPLLSQIINGDNKNLVIIGEVRTNSEALNTLLLNVIQGKLNAVVIPPPAYNDDGLLFMEDIALYVGSRLFTVADDIKTVKDSNEFFGSATRVQINQDRAIIFAGSGSGEDIEVRVKQLKENVAKETDSHRKDQLEQRLSKLTGKIAIVNVGGSTQTEMEELRYRVEDAIEATKSAMSDGVLPGGATMFVQACELDISKLFKDALKDTFSKLMDNAAESADFRFSQVRKATFGYGFNLREMTDEPVDLTKAGIWDATRAIVQTVENATSAAGSLLTVGAICDPIEQKEEANDQNS